MRTFDASGAFAPTVPGGGNALRRVAVRGAGMTIFSGAAGLVIQLVATVVLARLLTPRDFGLVAMVTTFSLLLMNCGFNGITEVVVQRETMNRSEASSLFWINLGMGVLLTLAFASTGSLLARFYGEKPIAQITAGMSLTVVLTSVSVVHLALLKRAMRFSQLAINDIVARAISVALSGALGCAGWGYWALVAGACALPLSTAIGAWWLCSWMPGRPRRTAGTGSMLKFAMHTYGRFSVNYFTRNADNFLVGWRFGAHSLGFYKKAYDLFALPASQLASSTTMVAVSALSRVRGDPSQYRRYLLGGMTVMTFVGMGLAADLTLTGHDLIRVLLGPGWESAGRIFTFFAPGIGVMTLYHTHGWIHLSIGRADRWFLWGIVECVTTCLLLICGLGWGPQGIAVAWCLSFWMLTIPAMWYAGKPIDLGVTWILQAVWRYFAASLVAGFLSWQLMVRWIALPNAQTTPYAALRVLWMTISFVVLYIGAIVLLHGGFAPMRHLLRLLRDMVSSSEDARSTAESRAAVGAAART